MDNPPPGYQGQWQGPLPNTPHFDEVRGILKAMGELPIYDTAELTTRLRNILINEGIKTIEEIASRTRNDWLRCPYVGQVTLEEIEQLLKDNGLSLRVSETQALTVKQVERKIHDKYQDAFLRVECMKTSLENAERKAAATGEGVNAKQVEASAEWLYQWSLNPSNSGLAERGE